MDLAYERTPIGSIVDVVRSVIQARGRQEGHQPRGVDVADDAARVYVDPGRIKQVLYNLISQRHQVHAARRRRCALSARRGRRTSLRSDVADTGVGIARENLPRLFREFEQLPQPRGVRPEGTGLGLALTRAARRALHGGKVAVESELGQGSMFSVYLPWRADERRRVERWFPDPRPRRRPRSRRIRRRCDEDEADTRTGRRALARSCRGSRRPRRVAASRSRAAARTCRA